MFRQLHYELLRGFAYRRIKHQEMPVYTTWLPIVLAFIIVGIYILLPVRPVLTGKDGAAASALSIMSTLPGFYFAGLAAVATFGSAEMDKEMPHPAPTIDIVVSGRKVSSKLTRRLFLTYLFSYLVLLSFIVCFALLFLNTMSAFIDFIQVKLAGHIVGVWL